MGPNPVNQFLPAGAMDAVRMGVEDPHEDEFDLAKYKRIKDDCKQEQKHLDQDYGGKLAQLETQVRGENDRLVATFQQAMQHAFAGIQQAVDATVSVQVQLRLEQERVGQEYDARKRDVERRYNSKAQQLMSMSLLPRSGTLGPRPSSRASLTPSVAVSTATIGDQRSSPAAPNVPRAAAASRGQHHNTVPLVPNEPAPRQMVPESKPRSQLPTERIIQEPIPQKLAAAEPAPIDSRATPAPAQPMTNEPVFIAPRPAELKLDEQAGSRQTKRASKGPTATPSRQDAKRKAAESPTTNGAATTAKRPRMKDRDRQADEARPSTAENQVEQAHVAAQSPVVKQSPGARRPSQAVTEKQSSRTITFDEVYQDGNAPYKHKIFEFKPGSGNWYIVKCDEHGVHFGHKNPVHGAAKHLHSPQHGMLEKKHDLAIEICGHLVKDCNAELADLNNSVFERAIEEGYVVFNTNLLTKEGRRRLVGEPTPSKSGKEGSEIHVNGDTAPKKKPPKSRDAKSQEKVTQPEAGRFYQGFWQSNKKWYLLIVLPIRPDGSLSEVGLREKLQETDLMGRVPKCYRVDRISLQIKGWQPAYEDGGAKVKKREFPVMFFDRYPYSLGWLPAHKLREIDLDNPPADVDKKGLEMARDWCALRINHRKTWEEFKKLGPGEPPSATSSADGDRHDQISALRSAHKQDEQSPLRDKSSKVEADSSSDDGSDDEGTTMMDTGPIREADDSNHGGNSESEDSNVVMEDAQKDSDDEHGKGAVQHSTAIGGNKVTVGSRHASRHEVEIGRPVASIVKLSAPPKKDPAKKDPAPKDSAKKDSPEDTSRPDLVRASKDEQPDEPRSAVSTMDIDEGNLSRVLSEHERVRKSAQARAAAAVKEAASRSRASSELPEEAVKAPPVTSAQQSIPQAQSQTQVRPDIQQRPAVAEYQRSRSEDVSGTTNGTEVRLATNGLSKSNEGRKPPDLNNILNHDSSLKENAFDSYQRFDALKAQMSNDALRVRPASVPGGAVQYQSPFQPPPIVPAAPSTQSVSQQSPSLSNILSPPIQSPALMARDRSCTTLPGGPASGRSTPTMTAPGNSERWQAVRTPSCSQVAQIPQGRTPRASFTSTAAPTHSNGSGHSTPVTTPWANASTAKADTAVTDKREVFDVTQFIDSARHVRWLRETDASYLRFTTDPLRGVAETMGNDSEDWTAAIEPAKVSSIETETPDKDKQWVRLLAKDGGEQVLVFSTNSASGRMLNAKVQGRRFVGWVKKMNGEVELSSG